MNGQKGALEVQLGLEDIPAGFIADVGSPAEGMYVCLTVRDAGLGMNRTPSSTFSSRFYDQEVGKAPVSGCPRFTESSSLWRRDFRSKANPAWARRSSLLSSSRERRRGHGAAWRAGPRGEKRILLVEDDQTLPKMTKWR